MHPQRLGVRAPFSASSGTRAAHLAAAERQAARSAQRRSQQKHLPLHESSESGPCSGLPATSGCRTMPGAAAASAQPPALPALGAPAGRPAALDCEAARKRGYPAVPSTPAPSVAAQQPPAQSAGASRASPLSAGGQQRAGEAPEVPARPQASCHSPFKMLDDLLFPHVLR